MTSSRELRLIGDPNPTCCDRLAARSFTSSERPSSTCDNAAMTSPQASIPPLSSARREGSPRPHLHRDWAQPSHICTGTGLTPAHPRATGRTGTSPTAPPRPRATDTRQTRDIHACRHRWLRRGRPRCLLSAPASVAAALTDGSGAAAAGEAKPGVTEYEYLRALNESLMDQMDASVTRSHLRPLPPHGRSRLRLFPLTPTPVSTCARSVSRAASA